MRLVKSLFLIILIFLLIMLCLSFRDKFSFYLYFCIMWLICTYFAMRYFKLNTGIILLILGVVLLGFHFIFNSLMIFNYRGQYCIPPICIGLAVILFFKIFPSDIEERLNKIYESNGVDNIEGSKSGKSKNL